MTRDQKRRIKRVLREIEAEIKNKLLSKLLSYAMDDEDMEMYTEDELGEVLDYIGELSNSYIDSGKIVFLPGVS